MTNNIYEKTLLNWCDRMCELQITDRKEPYFFGGILCPACGRIHGRIADVVYPMLTAAKVSGNSKYIDAAQNAFTWAEKNVLRKNGGFYNDQCASWTGITTFLCTSIAEALIHCGDIIDEEFKDRLKLRLREGMDLCYDLIPQCYTVINYKLSIAGALAACGKALGDEEYIEKAKGIVKKAPYYFGKKDGLLWGEFSDYTQKNGNDAIDIISPKNCRSVDIGYNLEETIPSLCLYAEITEDKEFMEFLKKVLYDHIYFMLSDGGWDNSFGVRHAKWTYWGSRTSDGCQGAYGRFAHIDPMFGEVAHRSFMQYVNCTDDGLLFGGPMYHEENELPCVHHTFCHAKSAADLIHMGFSYNNPTELPFDKGEAYKYFPSADVHLLRRESWRATVSGFDIPAPANHFSTATLTLLQHDGYGTVFAASMPIFTMVEPTNMQFSMHTEYKCQTPRIEYTDDSGYYTNMYNRECEVSYSEDKKLFSIKGSLKNAKFQGDVEYNLNFDFSGENAVITASAQKEAYLVLPVVAASKDTVKIEGNTLTVLRNGCTLTLKANGEITSDYQATERNFNPCGGFATYPVKIKMPAHTQLEAVITIS